MSDQIKEFENRLTLELQLESARCNICGSAGAFQFPRQEMTDVVTYERYCELVNLRENLVCRECGSSSRDRMMVYALSICCHERAPLKEWKKNPAFRLFETSGQRTHPKLLSEKFDYYNTEYVPHKMTGNYDLRHFADVQSLRFDDSYFDGCLSSDVFEHVRLHEKGFSEFHRVLKPGGFFILTVPYVHGWPQTQIRVQPKGDEDLFLMEPIYHAAETLVYRIYGRDLLDLLRSTGFSVAYLEGQWLKHAISFQNAIIAINESHIDLSALLAE